MKPFGKSDKQSQLTRLVIKAKQLQHPLLTLTPAAVSPKVSHKRFYFSFVFSALVSIEKRLSIN
ncbi:MAG: hypothetical protein K2Y32_10295 [Candidatus Obscuribacterales bacterium]|nr:hypothetical protein [Candidatus Obscuribacterales bacterium]